MDRVDLCRVHSIGLRQLVQMLRLLLGIEVYRQQGYRVNLRPHAVRCVIGQRVNIDRGLQLRLHKCRFFAVNFAQMPQQFFLFPGVKCPVGFCRLYHGSQHQARQGLLIARGFNLGLWRAVELRIQHRAKTCVFLFGMAAQGFIRAG